MPSMDSHFLVARILPSKCWIRWRFVGCIASGGGGGFALVTVGAVCSVLRAIGWVSSVVFAEAEVFADG